MKNIRIFYLKNFHFLVENFSVYLNRCVFVMYFGCIDSQLSFLLLLLLFIGLNLFYLYNI